ncbi:MAG: peptidylprolyl isomerase [Gammaproteobacteria bacterium]|jgi:FKBP-type peptidyl-prolyl cis-trans isomerase SlyD
MKIQDNCVVAIHYTLTNDEGDVLDTSEGREPLRYLQGHGNIIPGLERALEGLVAGDSANVVVEPEEGYGPKQDMLIQAVPREAFDGIDVIEIGMQFQAQTAQGPIPVTVIAVDEETVTLDGNHELAGVRLNFAVQVTEVREASAEEIDHGHVH